MMSQILPGQAIRGNIGFIQGFTVVSFIASNTIYCHMNCSQYDFNDMLSHVI